MFRLIFVCALAFFSSVEISRAEIISLDLLAQGCPTEWQYDTPCWQTDFDLGVSFSEISHVYVDWSGELTGSLVETWYMGSQTTQQIPMDMGLIAGFDSMRRTSIYGGKEDYPDSVTFNYQSEIVLWPSTIFPDWTDILDGTGTFSFHSSYVGEIHDPEVYLIFLDYGSVTLTSAALVIDGVLVPEPSSLVLFCLALPIIMIFAKRKGTIL